MGSLGTPSVIWWGPWVLPQLFGGVPRYSLIYFVGFLGTPSVILWGPWVLP